ncbi:hypothetical protein BGX24_008498 [Mortierella sp. AD032]|nr:hypothetical protein BGX24_008498 [Mortierella sp. AD032]
MARIIPLHIDIPSAPTHLLLHNKKTSGPHSPGVFDDATTTRTKDNEASFFSLTRNGSHYPDSPSSDISSPMMTPLPFKMMMDPSLPLPLPPMAVEKDDRKKLREYEFPSSVAIKVEGMPAYHQSYQNHPFTQLRQPRQQQQHQQNQQLSTPPAAKAMTPAQLSYSAKYANFTTNSTTTTTITPQQQPVVRVSPRPTHIYKDNNTSSRKPSTTMALSMIEKEKMTYQYPSHRVSMVLPPPPPYISASPSPSSTDHGAGVGVGANTTTTTANTQSAVTAAAIIAVAPPLQQVPDQQLQQLPYDPSILTPASLAALTQNKRHSYPVGLARSASSSSSFSSPAIIIAGSGATMMSDNGATISAPRVISPKSTFPRDTKRHSLAGIPSSSSSMTVSIPVGMARPKLISHRGSNMPPQAIPIYSSTGSSAATTEMMMTMMMKTPPTAFNPRSSLSSTRLLESLKHASSSSASSDSDGMGMVEKDLSDLIGPEDDHKNPLPLLLSQANIHHHNMTTSSSPPRTQQQGLLRIASLQRATAAASAAERNLIMSTSRIGGGGGSTTTGGGPIERNAEFPGYWEDARQHRMHWTVYSIGLATIGSLVWVLMMPALMVWAPILPGVVVLLMGAQYSSGGQ